MKIDQFCSCKFPYLSFFKRTLFDSEQDFCGKNYYYYIPQGIIDNMLALIITWTDHIENI